MRRRYKDELHKQYPKSIPLLEPQGLDESIAERINNLEQFLDQFICDVKYMKEYDGETFEKDFEKEVENVGKIRDELEIEDDDENEGGENDENGENEDGEGTVFS